MKSENSESQTVRSLNDQPLLSAAGTYDALGWSLVPIVVGTKRPACDWKEYQHRRAPVEQLKEWFAEPCEYGGLAVVLGAVSGRLAVRDFDVEGSYERWADDNPEYARRMPTARTARGAHVYFILPEESEIRGTIRQPGGGESRADGGIVVLPPSEHPSGARYEWINPPSEKNLIEIEPSEIGLATAKSKKSGPTPTVGDVIKEGERNATLTSLAGTMRRPGMSPEAILVALRHENETRCDPPLDDAEVAAIAKSVGKYEPSVPVSVETFNRTDLGNAKRFVALHGANVRHVPHWRRWLIWNGMQWEPDESGEAQRRMKATIAGMLEEAARLQDSRERQDLAKWAINSESENRIRAALKLAETEQDVPITPNQLDTNPWLLNCLNGTLDLSGERARLREHRKEDLITKLIRYPYDPNVTWPTWTKFLNEIFSQNTELMAFVQKAVGYALTGCIREHALFITYGTGRNGKTTFLGALSRLLDGYALSSPMETFLTRKGSDRIPNDLARLKGARFVVASESEQGQRLREAVIKQLTGGDRITARFLHQEWFEFDPTFKIFLICNHKPLIRGTDIAMWERIHLIPFDYTIPRDRRDTKLSEKLKEELPGILRWAVEGCEYWHHFGLGRCEAVSKATSAYREEMDVLRTFVDSECQVQPEATCRSSELYQRYREWAERNGEYKLSQKVFSLRMKEMGFEKDHDRSGMCWFGVGLEVH